MEELAWENLPGTLWNYEVDSWIHKSEGIVRQREGCASLWIRYGIQADRSVRQHGVEDVSQKRGQQNEASCMPTITVWRVRGEMPVENSERGCQGMGGTGAKPGG